MSATFIYMYIHKLLKINMNLLYYDGICIINRIFTSKLFINKQKIYTKIQIINIQK